MPLLQCLTEREGDTFVHVAGTPYHFKKDNEIRKGVPLAHVEMESHVRFLLRGGQFKIFGTEEAEKQVQPEPVIEDVDLDAVDVEALSAGPAVEDNEPGAFDVSQLESVWDTVKFFKNDAFQNWCEDRSNHVVLDAMPPDLLQKFHAKWKEKVSKTEPFPHPLEG